MPGSTFKVITADGGARERAVHARLVLPADRDRTCRRRPTDPIENYGGTTCGGDLRRGLPAQLQHRRSPRSASTLGAPDMVADGRARSASTRRSPIDLPRPAAVAASATVADFVERHPAARRSRGFGQNDVQATPLQMALVAAGVANDGEMMTPHVVAETRDRDGNVLDRTTPQPWLEAR